MERKKDKPWYMNVMDQKLWSEPALQATQPTLPSRLGTGLIPIPKEAKPKNEKKRDKLREERAKVILEEQAKKGIALRNNLATLTSILISICLSPENPNYQLLYLMCALKEGIKFISTTLRKEGFAQLYMVGMKGKLDWDMVKSNTQTFNEVIADFLVKSGTVCMIAAKGRTENIKIIDPNAPFVALLSAADVPTPCKGNLCVGTGWVIYRRRFASRKLLTDKEVYNCGRKAITGGVCINGCTTSIITGFKKIKGVQNFLYDPRVGDFMMYQEGLMMRTKSNVLSVNEGLYYVFNKEIQDWLKTKKNCKTPEEEYYSRYTGGWLTDAYRIICIGGVLLSPRDLAKPDGRVSLLFEAVPLAFLAERSGGKATDGKTPILKLPGGRQEKLTHLVLGSAENVDEVRDLEKQMLQNTTFMPLESEADSDDTSTDF